MTESRSWFSCWLSWRPLDMRPRSWAVSWFCWACWSRRWIALRESSFATASESSWDMASRTVCPSSMRFSWMAESLKAFRWMPRSCF